MIKIYNTLSRKIEDFKSVNPLKMGMYSCGPTVYDYPHIGNLRAYVFVDTLRRTLEFNGFEVNHVMNITDVGHLTSQADTGEDKMEVAARRERKDAFEIARFYEKEFFEALEKLNIQKPTTVCRATEHIKEMIDLIKLLEEKGFTYKISDGIYFDTTKIKDYNQLSGMPLEKLKEGARVEPNPEKRNPTDFALWKFSPTTGKRQMEWDSPWGIGFPGWHIECSAMGMKYLGEAFESGEFHPERSRRIDIHTGGVDHIPIHHTNEIAQNEAATGQRVVNFWIHSEFLLVEGEKMSKSLRNFYNIHDIEEKGFDPLALRYLFLTTHYRSKMNFTWEALEGAQEALNHLRNIVSEWEKPKIGCAEYEQKFLTVINNDLNMPEALSVVWELVKSDYPTHAKAESLFKMDEVLGLDIGKVQSYEIPQEVKELVAEREKLRKQKRYHLADQLRNKIKKLGYLVEDKNGESEVKKIAN